MGSYQFPGSDVVFEINKKYDLGGEADFKQIVDSQGQSDIRNIIKVNHSILLPNGFVWLSGPAEWTHGDNVHKGKLTTRIASFLYKEYKIKVDHSLLESIGNVVAQHILTANKMQIRITDKFDWNAGDFGDRGSCFWGVRETAKTALRDGGGLAIQFFREGHGFGRCWLWPTDKFAMLFNIYGFSGQNTKAVALVADMTKLYYREVALSNDGDTTGTIWIGANDGLNRGRGFAVGPKESIVSIKGFDLQVKSKACPCCDKRQALDDKWYTVHGGEHDKKSVCVNCARTKFKMCYRCDGLYDIQAMEDVGNKRLCCPDCVKKYYKRCIRCDRLTHTSELIYTLDGPSLCESCLEKSTRCKFCGDPILEGEYCKYHEQKEETPIRDIPARPRRTRRKAARADAAGSPATASA